MHTRTGNASKPHVLSIVKLGDPASRMAAQEAARVLAHGAVDCNRGAGLLRNGRAGAAAAARGRGRLFGRAPLPHGAPELAAELLLCSSPGIS